MSSCMCGGEACEADVIRMPLTTALWYGQDTEDMWARKLQQLTDMGIIPDYRRISANAARKGG